MTLSNFNATTPQSKVVESFFWAVVTLDIRNVEPFISKDLKLQTFPKHAALPDEPRANFLEKYGSVLSLLKKIEVRVQNGLGARRLRSIIPSTISTK